MVELAIVKILHSKYCNIGRASTYPDHQRQSLQNICPHNGVPHYNQNHFLASLIWNFLWGLHAQMELDYILLVANADFTITQVTLLLNAHLFSGILFLYYTAELGITSCGKPEM